MYSFLIDADSRNTYTHADLRESLTLILYYISTYNKYFLYKVYFTLTYERFNDKKETLH